jgi:3-deoxy-D-manno-octulosonic-acid transferase
LDIAAIQASACRILLQLAVRIIYSISIRFYVAAIFLASFFNKKAKLWIDGRKNCEEKNAKKAKEIQGCVWFHCASLGEFEMARPLIERLKAEKPSTKILLTFFSPSGYEIRKNYPLADLVIYIPADTRTNAYYFIEAFKPSLAIFVKYEIWLNMLAELKKNRIKTILISAVFNKEQRFFKWYGKIFREALIDLDEIYVQDQNSNELLSQWNIRSKIAGDTRYDRVFSNSKNVQSFDKIKKWRGDLPVIIAGSSWQPEEDAVAHFANENRNIKIIFAPHDISEKHISDLIERLKIPFQKYSNFNTDSNSTVLIIDNIGMLSSLYQYADIAIIGGGFSGKLHNILEAATFGIPLLFGPHHKRFHEAQEFINAGAAFTFDSKESLNHHLQELLKDENKRQKAGKASIQTVQNNLGATEKIWNENFIQML